MDLAFLSQADALALKLELARQAFETAKTQFDAAKQAFEELLGTSEERGIPRAKLKKLTEDRVLALLESGIVGEARAAGMEVKRARKPAKKSEGESAEPASDLTRESESPVAPEASANLQ